MSDTPNEQPRAEKTRLPESQELALFLAGAFKILGGALSISSDGKRYMQCPEPCMFRGAELPQLPEPDPWEKFHNEDEWRGAFKFASYWVRRLSPADTEFVFELTAPSSIDPKRPFDFRGLMTRHGPPDTDEKE